MSVEFPDRDFLITVARKEILFPSRRPLGEPIATRG